MSPLLVIFIFLVGADPCAGVLDRTEHCDAPADEQPTIHPDEKKEPAPIPGVDSKILPGELGFIAAGFAVGGGAAIGISYAGTNAFPSADETAYRDGFLYTGIGLLVASGLAASAALTFAVFDPSTGTLRVPAEGEGS